MQHNDTSSCSREMFNSNSNSILFEDRWSEEEHARFLAALERHRPPYDWNLIAAYVGTRSASQVQHHANCYFIVLQRRLPFAAALGQSLRVTARDMYQDLAFPNPGVNPNDQQQLLQYQQMQFHQQQGSGVRGSAPPGGPTRRPAPAAARPPFPAPPTRSATQATRLSTKRRLDGEEETSRNPLSIDFLLSNQTKKAPSAEPPAKAKREIPPVLPLPSQETNCGTLTEQEELDAELALSQKRCAQMKMLEDEEEQNRWDWVKRRILGPRSYQYWFPIFKELIPLSKKEITDDVRVLKLNPQASRLTELPYANVPGVRAQRASGSKRPTAPRQASGSYPMQMSMQQNDDEDEDNDKWVQCDRCHKWRRLPASVDMRDIQRQRRWFCEMNPDRKRVGPNLVPNLTIRV